MTTNWNPPDILRVAIPTGESETAMAQHWWKGVFNGHQLYECEGLTPHTHHPRSEAMLFELTEASCVEDKNRMLNMCDVDHEETFLENCQSLLNFLSTSAHKWQRVTYCYKACEIATRLRDRCDTILMETKNWKRRNRIEALKMEAWATSEMYHGLQMNQMHPV